MGKEIYEIIVYGRGGQGAKTASMLIADAAIRDGKFVQAFPEYGPERAGAPVAAYARISDKPIRVHSAVEEPNLVVVIDPTLIGAINVTKGLTKDDILVINHPDTPKEMNELIRKELKFAGKVFYVDATKISMSVFQRNIPNTVMLGAVAKVVEEIDIEKVKDEVRAKFEKKLGERGVIKNYEVIEMGFEGTKELE